MPIKGARDIKDMTSAKSYKDVKNLEDVRHIDAIKRLKDIKTPEHSEGGGDYGGLFQFQTRLQDKTETLRRNVQAAQSRLQTGVITARETLGENTQKLRENVEQVGDLPQTLKKALIHKAVETGVRQIKTSAKRHIKNTIKMPLEATKSGLESVEGAIEKMVETGVSATQKVLGKSAGKSGQDLKKPPREKKKFLGFSGYL